MGLLKAIFIFEAGVYSGIYIDQNYQIPRADNVQELTEKAKEFASQVKEYAAQAKEYANKYKKSNPDPPKSDV
jgi:hypothetical protein